MYKLFLVDDEIDLVEGIKSSIDWLSYDIEICGDADNGITALEKILMHLPDIVIMDIRMPKMSGLELLQNITAHKLNTKCIILSGYDDFSYAKKAIELKATNYLLKPCRPNDILEAVLNVKNIIEKENIKENLLKKYQLEFNENLPNIKESFLKRLLKNTSHPSYDLSKKIEALNVNLTNSNLLVSILRIDYSTVLYDLYSETDIEVIKHSIKDLTRKTFSDFNFFEILEDEDDIILILSLEESNISNDCPLKTLNKLKNSIKINLGFSITIALGNIVDSIFDINKSYNEAYLAIGSKFFLGDDRIIQLDDINSTDAKPKSYPLGEELAIINCLRIVNKSSLKSNIEDFYNHLSKDGVPSKKHMQGATLSLLGSIYKFCVENDIDINSLSNKNSSPFDKILKCETISEIKDQVYLILNSIFYKINELDKKNSLVKVAINYIIKNYDKDISLDSISKEIYITSGYLSQLFKQETGVNFLEFVHKYRIEKSKELFKNKTFKNYEIAAMVGYGSEKYFSKTFKKYTGLTPTQYRESINT